jgi:hypothetical protein
MGKSDVCIEKDIDSHDKSEHHIAMYHSFWKKNERQPHTKGFKIDG